MPAILVTVSELSQRFGPEQIFSNISFQVTERERVALVGPNGSGKSSLLKILAGLAKPATGSVDAVTGLRFAYQAQEAHFTSDRTVYEEALEAFRDVRTVGERLSAIEQEMATAGDEIEQLFEEYSRLSAEFEARHGYEMEHRTAQVLSGLGFPEAMFDQPVRQLSGGQKTRVSLGKTLLSDPDLLLLDEPTNHLDLEAIEWLEGFLQNWNRAFVVVSHDRYFLNKVTNRTLEMNHGRLEDYPAAYMRYLELREERRERQQKEYEEQQEYIARTEEFIRKYKAGQRSREARGRETRLARLERVEKPPEEVRLNLAIHADQQPGRLVISTDPLTIGYPSGSAGSGSTVLVRTGELVVERGDRVALIGPNGSGKTTALRTIVGQLPALAGDVQYGTNVKLAYYAQGHEGLDPNRTVLDTILYDQPMGEEQARTLLGRFLFSNDDVYKQVSSLSGGERSRLAIARLTLERANVLVLDEPTNHLDILARETLEQALSGYDGTIVFVSHDRYFIDKLANRVWAIEDGRVATYLGNYSEMLDHRARTAAAEAAGQSIGETRRKGSQSRSNGVSRSRGYQRLLDRQIRDTQRALEAAEQRVGELEERINRLSDDLARASADQDVETLARLGREYEAAQQELEQAYATWTAASDELQELTETPSTTGGGA